ncbi:MAG: Na+/H+ antiporter subunit E [Chloroflexota bacterium]|nr:Na+/H+ antiporter subunit E [Chloroflexota bacterium]MBI5703295.1 Na+/H+ antiporter subunit E [Chloroflexota bacterium]
MSQMLQVSVPLFIVYLALTGNVEPSNLVIGALIAVGVSLLRPKMDLPLINPKRLPQFLWAGIRYIFIVAGDVIRGGISTARIVLDPKLPINPGIIAIPSGTRSELGTALSAHSISLSPGEMVVAIDDDGVMYTHCLNVDGSERMIANAQSLRKNLLSRMFE